jgi:hypothetical protein
MYLLAHQALLGSCFHKEFTNLLCEECSCKPFMWNLQFSSASLVGAFKEDRFVLLGLILRFLHGCISKQKSIIAIETIAYTNFKFDPMIITLVL